MSKDDHLSVDELLLDTKMSKFELVFLASEYAKILKNKKGKEFKNNTSLINEILSDILLKTVTREEILKKMKDRKTGIESHSKSE